MLRAASGVRSPPWTGAHLQAQGSKQGASLSPPHPHSRPSQKVDPKGPRSFPIHQCPGCCLLATSTCTHPAAAALCITGKPHATHSGDTERHGSQVSVPGHLGTSSHSWVRPTIPPRPTIPFFAPTLLPTLRSHKHLDHKVCVQMPTHHSLAVTLG